MNTDNFWKYYPSLETRWISPENWDGSKGAGGTADGGRKGSAHFPLPAGASKVLADVRGTSGTFRRMWATLDHRGPAVLRGLRIEIYWDGAETPAVNAPWGDFFCQPLGRCSVFENAFFANPEKRSFITTLPMPFRSGMKIVVHNEGRQDIRLFFFDINYTVGDDHGDDMLYLHAHWSRQNPTTAGVDFETLPKVNGAGRYLGAVFGVKPDAARYGHGWWGEGESKVYLDGDDACPTLVQTGVEDYIGTAWGQGCFAQSACGCHLLEKEEGLYGFYRFHIADPVYFHTDIRVTIQQIGFLTPPLAREIEQLGTTIYSTTNKDTPIDLKLVQEKSIFTLYEREDDYSACAYFYLNRAENGLPPLRNAEERIMGLPQAPGSTLRVDD